MENYIKILKLFCSIISYPSVFLHESSHYIACLLCNIKVDSICWLNLDVNNPILACVYYWFDDEKDSLWKLAFINFAPLIFYGLPALYFSIKFILNPHVSILEIYCVAQIIGACIPSSMDVSEYIKVKNFKQNNHYKL